MIHHISAEYLTVDRVREILENNIKIDLSEDAKKRIVRCREYLDNKMETQKEPIYGITTGFGSLCNISIDKDQLSQLQKNLVMSHACGTGERVPAEIVKLMLLLKIQSLSYGNSGVQLETVQRLVDFFNNDVLPVVFQQGSLGASGDLAPLANMCRCWASAKWSTRVHGVLRTKSSRSSAGSLFRCNRRRASPC
jgi:histidine ammonia-lyase